MEPFTPEQNNQLKSWASERDSILSEIANLRTESSVLKVKNDNLAQSNTEIADKINLSLGRLAELEIKDAEMVSKVSSDISGLTTEKAALQSEVSSLKNEIETLNSKKDNIIQTINFATDVYGKVFERTNLLDRVIGHVVTVSDENIAKVNNLTANLSESIQKVLDVNEANVEKTNYVITELPKIFFAMQKHAPIKKTM